MKRFRLFEEFARGYRNSKIDSYPALKTVSDPQTLEDWDKLFKERSDQMASMHTRSRKVEKVISTVESLLTGEHQQLSYNDFATSTAGFQWGREFVDRLAADGLLKVVKRGNEYFAALGLPEELAKEMVHRHRGRVAGKRFNF